MYKCKKQTAIAVIKTDIEVYVGWNWCKNKVESCPQEGMPTGQGYELCKSVCGQRFHAETDALNQAGELAKGGTMYLYGHAYACDDCIEACKKAGIVKIVLLSETKVLWEKICK